MKEPKPTTAFLRRPGARRLTCALLATSLLANFAGIGYWGLRKLTAEPSYAHTYAAHKDSLYTQLPPPRRSVVVLGASQIDRGEWGELLGRPDVVNRGVGSATSADVAERLAIILESDPAVVVVMAGFNDLARGLETSAVVDNHQAMVRAVRQRSPGTTLVLQSVLPKAPELYRGSVGNDRIHALNERLRELCAPPTCRYLDVQRLLRTSTGDLEPRHTRDGVHLMGPAYRVWADELSALLAELHPLSADRSRAP